VDLLERAAVQAVRRRAGQRLRRGEPLPAAPPEDREVVSRAAADRLARIIGGEWPKLLPEWLSVAAARGLRVPPHLLPELLDHGARDRSIRPDIGALAGHRGRWLAALGDREHGAGGRKWAYLLEEPTGDGETWQLGTVGDRRALLGRLRASDPAAARELLASTWEQEGPDDRAAFLTALGDGLSLDDEPFLESALDDRRREVRQCAADLLTRLPGSRLVTRMAERGGRCLQPAPGGSGRIVVEPPDVCDGPMRRDGIRASPPRGTGEKSWWLQQVVARTPLSLWTTKFGASPEELLGMKIVDWRREVRAGWVRAAVLQGDAAWARVLFAWDPLAELLAALPPAEQEEVAVDFVRRHSVDGQMIMVLGGATAPWGRALTGAVLRKILDVAGTQPWNLGELVRLAGERADPAQHVLAAGLSPEQPVQEVAAVLRFRSDMVKELS
jgi:hypothetical protein